MSEYYPSWFWISEEASYWSSLSLVGMSPSFTFLFKILPEIGFFGILLFTVYSYPVLNQYKNLPSKKSIKPFAFSIVGFLIASFGVEGFLYFPFWIIVGVFVGYLRKFNS